MSGGILRVPPALSACLYWRHHAVGAAQEPLFCVILCCVVSCGRWRFARRSIQYPAFNQIGDAAIEMARPHWLLTFDSKRLACPGFPIRCAAACDEVRQPPPCAVRQCEVSARSVHLACRSLAHMCQAGSVHKQQTTCKAPESVCACVHACGRLRPFCTGQADCGLAPALRLEPQRPYNSAHTGLLLARVNNAASRTHT